MSNLLQIYDILNKKLLQFIKQLDYAPERIILFGAGAKTLISQLRLIFPKAELIETNILTDIQNISDINRQLYIINYTFSIEIDLNELLEILSEKINPSSCLVIMSLSHSNDLNLIQSLERAHANIPNTINNSALEQVLNHVTLTYQTIKNQCYDLSDKRLLINYFIFLLTKEKNLLEDIFLFDKKLKISEEPFNQPKEFKSNTLEKNETAEFESEEKEIEIESTENQSESEHEQTDTITEKFEDSEIADHESDVGETEVSDVKDEIAEEDNELLEKDKEFETAETEISEESDSEPDKDEEEEEEEQESEEAEIKEDEMESNEAEPKEREKSEIELEKHLTANEAENTETEKNEMESEAHDNEVEQEQLKKQVIPTLIQRLQQSKKDLEAIQATLKQKILDKKQKQYIDEYQQKQIHHQSLISSLEQSLTTGHDDNYHDLLAKHKKILAAHQEYMQQLEEPEYLK